MTEYNDELQMFWTWVKHTPGLSPIRIVGCCGGSSPAKDPHAGDDVRSM